MDCPNIPVIPSSELFTRMKQKAVDHRIPFSGSIELTYRCNMKCVHCYQGSRRFDHQPAELSTAEVLRITDEIVAEGCLYLLITGGEPFLRPDLFDILKYIKRKGVLITLFTNGTRINAATIGKLSECVPNQTEITLYGLTQATYEKITGIPGSHQKCMHGIELLHKHKIPFGLKTMVLTENFHELEGMKNFAESLGVKFRYDSMVHANLEFSNEPHKYRVTPEQVILADQVDGKRLKRTQMAWHAQRGQQHSAEEVFHCGAGINGFHINPSGNLSLCLMAQTPAYNLRTGTFKQGWDPFLKDLRTAKTTQPNPCTDCNLFALCGECPGRAMVEQDTPGQPNPFYCRVAHLRDALLASNLQ